MKNISFEQIDISELNCTELSKVNGGSSLSWGVFWVLGNMFDAPNRLREAGCSPHIMFG